MKCNCDTCGGSGQTTCEDCGGTGTVGFDISTLDAAKLNPKGKHFTELHALKQDAARVIEAQDVPESKDETGVPF